MTERELAGRKALEFCEGLWLRGDPWEFESSEYERARCARLLAILNGRRYGRVLELGCGAGYFTRLLAGLADHIVAYDIAPTAIARARTLAAGDKTIEFRVGNAMDYAWRTEAPWDLVVMNDTICYLGWLYPFFDIAWFASEIFEATVKHGRFLMANTMDPHFDKLLLPYITRTYRDLFLNVGFLLETEEVFRGIKNDVPFEILMSLFSRGQD